MNKEVSPGAYRGATASADAVRMLFTYLEYRKIDPKMLEAASGIRRHQMKRRVPVTMVNRLWQAAQETAEDPDFGLHLGEAFVHLAQGHLLFSVMRYSSTFSAALGRFFRYHSLMADIVQPRAVKTGSSIHCLLERKYPELPLERHHAEATFTIIYGSLNSLSALKIPLKEVAFRHEKPASTVELERFFQAPLNFGCSEERLVFQKDDLEQPVHSADPVYLSAHESLAGDLLKGLDPEGAVKRKVRDLVEKFILRGEQPRIATIAGKLNISVRKLQLLLKEEGGSFREIVNDTRKRLAKRFLGKPETTLCDVAFLLGFSEQSAFNHAFRRWTGLTPGQYLQE